ncbi:MAG TPA: hypothetical protein ENN43_01950 [bacterium]|nr:hypothetical protein [bacterium]
MPNKKMVLVFSFFIMAAGAALSFFLPEKNHYHIPFHLFIFAAVMLSFVLAAKDVMIIMLLACGVVWGMGFGGILAKTSQLMAETGVIIAVIAMLVLYDADFKTEKNSLDSVISYKKKEMEALEEELKKLSKENHDILEEIKNKKKIFVS